MRHSRRMPKRVRLPRALAERPFLYGSGRDLGIGEGRLRGSDLERPFHGVRALRDLESLERSDLAITLAACARFAPLLTTERFFSHATAAALWRCPLPRSATLQQLDVSVLAPHNAPRGRGVAGHRSSDPHLRIVTRYGFPVSDVASTWLSLSTLIPLDELVAVTDHLVLDPHVLDPHDPRPYATLESLGARAQAYSGRGSRALERALSLARVGAESRPETLLRLLLVRAGIPEPSLNVGVTSRPGRLLGRGDLVWPEWRTVVEYDGDNHRTSDKQYDRDIRRVEDFVAAEWRVVRVRKHGLFVATSDTVARVRSALAAGGWRPGPSNRLKST
ncbi:MAG: hypothetical protein QOH69_894 [Actinomycetota bacterium]|jgi:hypothetical protein|nr:hypothetical protein [Actinomycetota bacterium]